MKCSIWRNNPIFIIGAMTVDEWIDVLELGWRHPVYDKIQIEALMENINV